MTIGEPGWFFTFSRTTHNAEGTKTFEIRAGGRPAMVFVVGLGLLGIEFLSMTVFNPALPWWVNAISVFILLIAFSGLAAWQIYLTERRPGKLQQPEED